MYVLNIRFFCQVGDVFRVKFMASKDRRDTKLFYEVKAVYDFKTKSKAPKY